MVHQKIAELAGDARVFSMKGNPIDHCVKSTAGMAHGMQKAEQEVAENLRGKRKE